MSVVTLSREYGTGGREFGEKLAKELGFKFIDKKITHDLSQKTGISEGYIEHFLDTGIPMGMPQVPGEGVYYTAQETQNNVNLQIESHRLLKEIASKEDILIVGRASDIILSEFHPFRIFVYGDTFSKIQRIREVQIEGKTLGDEKDIQRAMQMIDTERYQHHALFSSIRWGEREAYDLCINMSNFDIFKMVKPLAAYIREVFKDS